MVHPIHRLVSVLISSLDLTHLQQASSDLQSNLSDRKEQCYYFCTECCPKVNRWRFTKQGRWERVPPLSKNSTPTNHKDCLHGPFKGRKWRGVAILLLIAGFYHTAVFRNYWRSRNINYTNGSAVLMYKDISHDQVSSQDDGDVKIAPPATPLQRFPKLLQIENIAQKDPQLGSCYKGKLIFPDGSHNICQEIGCLWSSAADQNIDLDTNLLLPSTAVERCPLPRGGQKAVGASGKPTVSFIITMHNHAYITSQCIIELFRTSHEVDSAEFVVIDDGSNEDTSAVITTLHKLRDLFGLEVTFYRNEKPLGYGPANTKGIELSSGKYIALINNDAFVLKGWLSSLVWTLQHRPNVGMVGPLFVNADGIIQEAGGVVYQSGFSTNVGRGLPVSPELNVARKVDYISAACVLIERAKFLEVGGFDFRYEHGYYEDTDLAFKLAKAGYDNVVQPLSVVYHVSGTTLGKNKNYKQQLLSTNKAKFVSKWKETLHNYHYHKEVGQGVASQRLVKKLLLWVEKEFTGTLKDWNALGQLQELEYTVSLATAVEPSLELSAKLRAMGVRVLEAFGELNVLENGDGVLDKFDKIWIGDYLPIDCSFLERKKLEIDCIQRLGGILED